jgi:hypothetical protein
VRPNTHFDGNNHAVLLPCGVCTVQLSFGDTLRPDTAIGVRLQLAGEGLRAILQLIASNSLRARYTLDPLQCGCAVQALPIGVLPGSGCANQCCPRAAPGLIVHCDNTVWQYHRTAGVQIVAARVVTSHNCITPDRHLTLKQPLHNHAQLSQAMATIGTYQVTTLMQPSTALVWRESTPHTDLSHAMPQKTRHPQSAYWLCCTGHT